MIRSESDRLKRHLDALDPERWGRPTGLEAWDVRHVVIHLTERTAELYFGTISRGVRGDVSEPPGFDFGSVGDYASRRRAIAEGPIARQETPAETLIEQFGESYDRLSSLLASLGAQDWDKPCWVPSGTRVVRDFIPLIIQELVIHGWDIHSRFEPWPGLSVDCVSVALQRSLELFSNPGEVLYSPGFSLGSAEARPVRCRVRLTGPAPVEHDLTLDGSRFRMEPPATLAPDVKLECDAETCVLLMYKRVTPDEAIKNDRLSARGDGSLIADFELWLADVNVAGLHCPWSTEALGAQDLSNVP